tara:strand:+ start:16983 stop:17213 length:231 start_codon:yes stop_codon:yes gene_type:complete
MPRKKAGHNQSAITAATIVNKTAQWIRKNQAVVDGLPGSPWLMDLITPEGVKMLVMNNINLAPDRDSAAFDYVKSS